MGFTKEQHRAYRQKMKAQGICTVCHKRPADYSPSICTECRERQRKYRADKVRDGVICKFCATPVFKHKMCEYHYNKTNEYRRNRRRRRIAQGLCGTCGKQMEDQNLRECIVCSDRRLWARRRADFRKGVA